MKGGGDVRRFGHSGQGNSTGYWGIGIWVLREGVRLICGRVPCLNHLEATLLGGSRPHGTILPTPYSEPLKALLRQCSDGY